MGLNKLKNIGIIGISGKIGSGKDSFAEIFATLSPIKVERHAFADNVKKITEQLVGHPMSVTHELNKPFANEVYNYTQEDKNVYLPTWDKTVGECLQLIGTELFRVHFDKDTWVKSLFSTYGDACIKRGNILIIPDVRFPNEADLILKKGGILIRLEGDPAKTRLNSFRDLNHISETALDDYDNFSFRINNDVPDISIFKDKIKTFINTFEN